MATALLTYDVLSTAKSYLISKIDTIAGSLPYDIDYDGTVTLTYSTTRISAAGGSTDTPTMSYSITVTDSDGNVETVTDGTLTDGDGNTSDISDAITITYSLSGDYASYFSVSDEGVVSASSRGTTTGSSRSVVVTCTVNYLGNTFTASETIKQSQNLMTSTEPVYCGFTLTYYDSDMSSLGTSKILTYYEGDSTTTTTSTTTIPAEGGRARVTATQCQFKNTFSSGSTNTSGSSSTTYSMVSSTGFTYSENTMINGTNYGTLVTASENTSTSTRTTSLTANFSYNGVRQSTSQTITQDAAE